MAARQRNQRARPPVVVASLLRRIGRALLPLVAAYACGAWLLADLLLELHVHRSRVLGAVGLVPALALAAQVGRWQDGGWTRRAKIRGAVRVVGLSLLFLALLLVFDHQHKDRGGWLLWVPAMTLDFAPSMLVALPGLAAACLLGLALSYGLVSVRFGRIPFLLAYFWPGLWMALALTGFYRTSFESIDAAAVEAQPGVELLAPSGATACGLFAKSCPIRLFPRGLALDPVTRKLYAGFGPTTRELTVDQPKLLSLSLAGGAATWLDGTAESNQVRGLALDDEQRLLAVAQWGRRGVGLYDLDGGRPLPDLPFPLADREEYQPAAVLLDGDRVFVVNIWYPRIVELSSATGAVVREVDLFDLGVVSSGVQLGGAALSRERRKMWLSVGQYGANVLELALDTLEPQRSLRLDASFPSAFAYDEHAGRIYASSFSSSDIEVVDVADLRRVDVLEGALGARELAVDPERQTLFVMDYLGGAVAFVSLRDGTVGRRVAVGPKPGGAVVFEGKLYVNATTGIVAITLD